MDIPVGKQFGRWTVLGPAVNKHKGSSSYVNCRCSCGTIKDVCFANLQNGRSTSCGCRKAEMLDEMLRRSAEKRFIDLTGQQFGEWTVVRRAPNQNHQTMWYCRCSCGVEKSVNAGRLRDGSSLSCGHTKFKDLTGQRFGHWVALEKAMRRRPDGHNCAVYKCLCDCGTIRTVTADTLLRGTSTSCGCAFSSKGNKDVENYLKCLGISYSKEVFFDDLRVAEPLRFDFFINDKEGNILGLIEYQGKQHYFESATDYHFGKFQRDISDPMKREYCQQHEIPLYEIRFDEDTYQAVDSILSDLHVDPVPSLGQSSEDGSTTIQKELAGGETPLREVPHTQNG